ncbi:MAG: hypothetical protein ABI562_00895 [Chloroflexota bacterium]
MTDSYMGTSAPLASTPTRRLPLRNTWEGTIKPTPSPEYARRKALLPEGDVLQSLGLVEDEIEIDPDNPYRRLDLDGVIYDRTQPGLWVVYKVIGGETILLTFRDFWDR